MNITVILCTYNRCATLSRALASVAASELPQVAKWEVIVVDNNSTDGTRAVVEEFCRQHPGRFRYLFESRQGLSQARNAGIREARGDILAFMDDDVTVEPTWLWNLTANLCDGEWAGAGGRCRGQRPSSPAEYPDPDDHPPRRWDRRSLVEGRWSWLAGCRRMAFAAQRPDCRCTMRLRWSVGASAAVHQSRQPVMLTNRP